MRAVRLTQQAGAANACEQAGTCESLLACQCPADMLQAGRCMPDHSAFTLYTERQCSCQTSKRPAHLRAVRQRRSRGKRWRAGRVAVIDGLLSSCSAPCMGIALQEHSSIRRPAQTNLQADPQSAAHSHAAQVRLTMVWSTRPVRYPELHLQNQSLSQRKTSALVDPIHSSCSMSSG